MLKSLFLHTALGFLTIVANVIFATPSSSADLQFGPSLTYTSEKSLDYAVSDDKKAFQINLNEFGLGENGKPPEHPVLTRALSVVVPMTGAKPGREIMIHFSGLALMNPGAHGLALFNINGKNHILTFDPSKKDKPIQETIKFKAGKGAEARITVIFVVDKEAGATDGAGYLRLTTIQTDTWKTKKTKK